MHNKFVVVGIVAIVVVAIGFVLLHGVSQNPLDVIGGYGN